MKVVRNSGMKNSRDNTNNILIYLREDFGLLFFCLDFWYTNIYIWLNDSNGNINYLNYSSTTFSYDTTILSPISLTAEPVSWEGSSFNVTWTNPPEVSGIIGAYYKLYSTPTSNTDGSYTSGVDLTTITGLTTNE